MKNILQLFASILILGGCNPKPDATIMTVNGPIQPREMGTTLSHEHVLVDFIGADSTGYHRWNRDDVVEKVLPYLLKAKQRGCQTLVECTPAYLGRDPLLLEMLSEKSGLHLLTNTGYYGAINNKFIPQHAFTETADQLSGRWTDEWINGIEDTDIKPGFIKISVARDAELSDLHEKLVKAAARTHLKTGLTIASHTGPAAPAYAQLDILKSEGVHPSAFIWVHAQRGDSTSHVRMAQQGAWISLDNVKSNPQNIERYTQMLSNMKQYNLLDRVLISHDAGWYKPGQPNGGQFRGYEAVFNDLVPSLENAGFSPREINQIMRQNPARAFRVQIRKID